MEHGTVKWYNDAKEFGFVKADSGDELIAQKQFILSDPKTLFEFQRVEFNRYQHEGKSICTDLRVVETKEFSLYDHEFITAEGELIHGSKYIGQIVLVVNVASQCGLTEQYEKLEKLYKQYKWTGNNFEILAFPSNNFAGQEPGSTQDILEFCRSKFNVSFTVMEKVNVIEYNKESPDIEIRTGEKNKVLNFFEQLYLKTNERPYWNFHKYLINKDAKTVLSFSPFTEPMSDEITACIESMIKETV